MSTPEDLARSPIPNPTGDAFVDYLEVRIAQVLCKEVGRREEGRQLAFAMGMATGRWVYLAQQNIAHEVADPIDFIALMKGRLSTLSVEDRARVISIGLASAEYATCRLARRELRDLLAIA